MSDAAGEVLRRRHRRVIALSDADRARLASGELARPEDAFEPEAEAGVAVEAGVSPLPTAADERLLREVPPHFGTI